jgi:hypothetical protein
MEAAPSAPFKVSEPDLLFELLIIAFDAPAQFGDVDQIAEGDVVWQRRQPVFGRLILTFGPLDQQPFFRWFPGPFMARCHTNEQTCKARRQPLVRAFPPSDRAPRLGGQRKRNLLHLRLSDSVRLAAERELVAAVEAAGGAVPLPDGRTVATGRAEFDALWSGRAKRAWVLVRKNAPMPSGR